MISEPSAAMVCILFAVLFDGQGRQDLGTEEEYLQMVSRTISSYIVKLHIFVIYLKDLKVVGIARAHRESYGCRL